MNENPEIQHCLELLCGQGCRTVSALIIRLEQGEVLPEIAHLDSKQQAEILHELKEIMAVYEHTGSCQVK